MDNEIDGYNFHKQCSDKDKQWFLEQWKRYPERVDLKATTNLAFLYGGLKAYREEHQEDPEMSRDFTSHVNILRGTENE